MNPRIKPMRVEDQAVKVISIGIGFSHSCALYKLNSQGGENRSKVKCWGMNYHGQLGIGSDKESVGKKPEDLGGNLIAFDFGAKNIKELFVGGFTTCVTDELGQLSCLGRNKSGALGIGDDRNRGQSPRDLGSNLVAAKVGLPVITMAYGNGADVSCAVLINCGLKCWGDNSFGRLGIEQNRATLGDSQNDLDDNMLFVKL